MRHWLYGLIAAVISGGSSAVTACFSVNLIAPDKFNLGNQLLNFIELAAVTFVINGMLGAFLYLKQSPIPPEYEGPKDPPAISPLIRMMLVASLVIFGLSGCASFQWQEGIPYLKPASELIASAVLQKAVSPEDRIAKANEIYAAAKAVRTLSGGEITKDAVEDVLKIWLPEKAHWSDFSTSASSLYAGYYAQLKGDPKAMAEAVEQMAQGFENVAGQAK